MVARAHEKAGKGIDVLKSSHMIYSIITHGGCRAYVVAAYVVSPSGRSLQQQLGHQILEDWVHLG